MAFKRHIDHLPIIPKDAKEFNVVCHYCIVGCGYKAWSGNVARAPVAQRFRCSTMTLGACCNWYAAMAGSFGGRHRNVTV
jgi:hypothetical protein